LRNEGGQHHVRRHAAAPWPHLTVRSMKKTGKVAPNAIEFGGNGDNFLRNRTIVGGVKYLD
jgi:hypothetical protein